MRAAQSPGFAAHVSREENIRVMNFSVLGNNQVFELRKNEKPVSQGIMILFEELPCALITDIYTMPYERGHGYAAQVVSRLCKEALAAQKTPILDCDSEQLERYYSCFGFYTCGNWSDFLFRQTKLLYYKGRENYDPSCHHRRSICSRPAL